jgi:hypothetical protein
VTSLSLPIRHSEYSTPVGSRLEGQMQLSDMQGNATFKAACEALGGELDLIRFG